MEQGHFFNGLFLCMLNNNTGNSQISFLCDKEDREMLDKDTLLKRVTKNEDRLLASKILDKAMTSFKSRAPVYTDFLDPHQAKIVEALLSDSDEVNYMFDGGYPGAERVVAVFRPNFISDDETFVSPFKYVTLIPGGRDALTHRDYLGAVLGLGIRRDKIGDILVKDESCEIVVLGDISEYLKYNLSKVGNINVEIRIDENLKTGPSEVKVKEIKATVASLRLDSVASSGFGVSRSKMADYIKAERVSLNWEITNSITKLVKEGDTISIRGKGRVLVESVGGVTKKGRTCLILKKFV